MDGPELLQGYVKNLFAIQTHLTLLQLVNNTADFAFSNFGYNAERNGAASLAAARYFDPDNWISKAPERLPNTNAILRIFVPSMWAMIFAVAFSFGVFLVAAYKLGRLHGIEYEAYEDFLIPFR